MATIAGGGAMLSNLPDMPLSLHAAIEVPGLHTEGSDGGVDDRVGDKALATLRRLGHQVVTREEACSTFYFARPVAVRVTGNWLDAGLDHLRAAAAAGH